MAQGVLGFCTLGTKHREAVSLGWEHPKYPTALLYSSKFGHQHGVLAGCRSGEASLYYSLEFSDSNIVNGWARYSLDHAHP